MIGLGVGINRQRFAQGSSFFAAYAARVAADGGVTEAGACVNAVSGISLSSSLLLVPSGYKAGKVYSQIPTNGNGDLTFTRASSATRVNSAGLVEVVESGIPRLDYFQGSCPALLLEPQRTNLVTYSEELNNAAWLLTNASVTANDAISPDGTLDADKFVESSDVSAQSHQLRSSTSPIVTNQVYTYSIFAKGSGRGIQLRAGRSDGSTFSTVNANYNLTLGVVSTPFQNNAEYISSSIEDYGDGWYRCILQMRFTDPTNTTMRLQVYLLNESTNNTSYIGDGTSGAYLWGAQIEAGSYVSSYIPTTSATVTRLADSCSKTGISSLIGQTEGTMFVEFDIDADVNTDGYIVRIDNTSFNDTVYISRSLSKVLGMNLRSGGTSIASVSIANVSGRNKAAIAYKSGDFAFYLNGASVGTSTATYTNGITYDDFRIGGFNDTTAIMSGGISQALLFPTRLSNAELAELTTL